MLTQNLVKLVITLFEKPFQNGDWILFDLLNLQANYRQPIYSNGH
jgi:hypothetical protein